MVPTCMTTPTERLARARLSLEGLSIGDAIGGFFEMSTSKRLTQVVTTQTLPSGIWHFTDDTNMALSIYHILSQHNHIHQDELASSFAKHYDRQRGYGPGTRTLIARMRHGEYWRDIAKTFYRGSGSFGNGGAMRVAPIGGYFADDIEAAITNARLSAEITHAHPEGIAGAIAVAAAAAVAWQWRDQTPRTRQEFLEQVISHIPPSEVQERCKQGLDLPSDTSTLQAAETLGNGSDVSAQRTVPFVLWCAGEYLHNFEEAIWQTLSAGGDADTNCAMVGGIVALYVGNEGIPTDWIEHREPLPAWAFS